MGECCFAYPWQTHVPTDYELQVLTEHEMLDVAHPCAGHDGLKLAHPERAPRITSNKFAGCSWLGSGGENVS
jgi:hypothetical protein